MRLRDAQVAPSSRWSRAARLALLALTCFLLATAGWIRFRFGEVTLEQILMNLPGQGEGAGNPSLVREGIEVCLGTPLLLTGLTVLVARLRKRGGTQPGDRRLGLHAVAFAAALTVFLTVAGVPQYASALLGNDSIARYYQRPAIAEVPSQRRNLVTIYIESGENTFADKAVFGENLIADLDRATTGWARHDGLQQYPGGGWTMAGLVSTECGIPLKSRLLLDGMNLNNFGEEVGNYLPGATCLGDILSAQGYTNVFLGGANSHFAGKDKFFHGHGYDRVAGLEQWESEGEKRSEVSVWGLSDRRLFAKAEKTIDGLRDAGAPFNLTLLTLDTHEPGGVFPSCTTRDEIAMTTAIKCSMRALAGFLEHLKVEGFLEDTVVVVMGDHLKATSEGGYFKDELEGTPDRTIIYRAWSPDRVEFNRDRTDQLSVLPTTLELLGFGLAEGRAGLGISFVNPHPLTGTVAALPEGDYRAVVTSPSTEIYRGFWGER